MFTIRKAEKKQSKLRMALLGVSGSGKTTGAINIAFGMGLKPVIIDTENKSADLFADMGDFDVLELDNPFTPERYISAIKTCESAGYEIIIIDSLSHAWSGEGGVLDMQDSATQASKSKNSYMAWKQVTPWQNKLINTILHSKAHIIVTMRAKTHYEIMDDGNGRKKPVKLGLAPIQREGLDYEFTAVLELDKESKIYSSSKDRTKLFEGKNEKLSKETGEKLLAWLNDGRSLKDIEDEEIERIKNNLLSASNIDFLRHEYAIGKNKYPSMADEFLSLCNQRKMTLQNGGAH